MPAVVHCCLACCTVAELSAWLCYKCHARWWSSRPGSTLPASDNIVASSALTRSGRCSAVLLQGQLALAAGTCKVRSVSKRNVD